MATSIPEESTESASEWEYEYDDVETESFYVTLEFPSDTVSESQGHGRGGDRRGPSYRTSLPRKENLPGADEAHTERSGHENDSSTKSGDTRTLQETVQVLDFASRQPIISRNGQVYTATWGRTIGTEIVLSTPGTVDTSTTVKRKFEGFDVVSVSRMKLFAKPVILEPRGMNTSDSEIASASISHGNVKSKANGGPGERASPERVLETEVADSTATHLQDNEQTSNLAPPTTVATKSGPRKFLDKFAEVRRKRGQTDPILVRSGRSTYVYTGGGTDPNGDRDGSEPELGAVDISKPQEGNSRIEASGERFDPRLAGTTDLVGDPSHEQGRLRGRSGGRGPTSARLLRPSGTQQITATESSAGLSNDQGSTSQSVQANSNKIPDSSHEMGSNLQGTDEDVEME